MTHDLAAFVNAALDAPVADEVAAFATLLAREANARAVLFYGSNLRSGALDGVLDFYVLTDGPVERGIWPHVGYRETVVGGTTLRAKIATMRLSTFARAAAGRSRDTTVWTRFAQPAALVWTRNPVACDETVAAVAAAATTAATFAAALGPERGDPLDFWRALFAETYAAELRVEPGGRHEQFLARDAAYYHALLPLAWDAAAVAYTSAGERLTPALTRQERQTLLDRWRWRRRLGRPFNVIRLVRAAFTFDGAARYAAWKIERHTGVPVTLTPWRERHPLLAAPGVLWRVWRAKAAR